MAARPVVLPVESETQIGQCDPHKRYEHDAFGVIVMSNPSGGDNKLFGSDVRHDHRVCIKIQRATLERSLSNDWIHGRNILLELEMSHAQFAQFITSSGNGSGTPVTLRYAQHASVTRIEEMPAIGELETKAETFRREIRSSANRQVGHIQAEIDKLGAMLETGKVSIKEARAIHHSLKCRAENLPSNMEFVVEQAEEALEKAQAAAKIQIESFIDHTARKTGYEHFARLGEQAKQVGNDVASDVPDLDGHN